MKYIIIGASAAGMQAAEEIRKIDRGADIKVFSKENYYPYSRCLISRYVDGRLKENNFFFKTDHFFEDLNIEAFLGIEVAHIDKNAKKIFTNDNREYVYDRLLIATGSSPIVSGITGIELEGVCTFHSWDDAEIIIRFLKDKRKAVIAGAGFIGLEAAYALTRQGAEVTVIEKMSQILPKQTDAVAASIIQDDLEKMGVKFIFNQSIASIEGKEGVGSVLLMDRTRLQCSIVIMATGVKPNTAIAEKAGILTGKGLYVNEYFQTSDKDIYAAGDVIEIEDITTGKREVSATWFNAVLQGKYAGYNMAGSERSYRTTVGMQNAVQFHQVPLISYGKVFLEPDDEQKGYEVISTNRENVYKKLVLNNNKICGMIFVGNILKSGFYAALIRNSIDISSYKSRLLDPDFSYAFFKDKNFEQYNPYYNTPKCWDGSSNNWLAHRYECQFN